MLIQTLPRHHIKITQTISTIEGGLVGDPDKKKKKKNLLNWGTEVSAETASAQVISVTFCSQGQFLNHRTAAKTFTRAKFKKKA